MKSYACDKCHKSFEFPDDIRICPYCGYSSIRDKALPMKKKILAKCRIVGRMLVIKHEDGDLEFLEFEGEQKINIIDKDTEYEEEIDNVEYERIIRNYMSRK